MIYRAHAGLAPWEGKFIRTLLDAIIISDLSAPFEGTNALDAAFAAYSNIAVLRQQIKPDCRVTGVIQGKDNGWVPNSM